MLKKFLTLTVLLSLFLSHAMSQQVRVGDQMQIDYNLPREYTIGGITVSGTEFIDDYVVVMVSQLSVGQTLMVPGEELAAAINNLWKQGLFQHVAISATSIQGEFIFLDIELTERPRLSSYSFEGLKRSEEDAIREKLNLVRGDVVTENLLYRAESAIADYFIEKGFLKPNRGAASC